MKSLSLAFVLILGLALAGCGRTLFHKSKTYSAMADMEVRPSTAGRTPGLNGGMTSPHYDATLALAEIKDMLSDANLVPVIQKLKLDQIWAKRLQSSHDILSPEEALDHLRKTLKIEHLRETDIFEIIAYSEIPQEAADIANAIADQCKTTRDQEDAARNQHDLDDLNNKIAGQSQLVAEKEAAVEKQRQALDQNNLTITTSPDDKSPLATYRAAQRELEEQQNVLNVLNNHLKQLTVDQELEESPVRILSRAMAPPE